MVTGRAVRQFESMRTQHWAGVAPRLVLLRHTSLSIGGGCRLHIGVTLGPGRTLSARQLGLAVAASIL
jgi:hypothetical protein